MSGGGDGKQAGLQHKHAILCSQLMAHSFLSQSHTHTHTRCAVFRTHVVQCFAHIIHNTHGHACLMSLLYSPTHTHTHKLFNIQYEHFC